MMNNIQKKYFDERLSKLVLIKKSELGKKYPSKRYTNIEKYNFIMNHEATLRPYDSIYGFWDSFIYPEDNVSKTNKESLARGIEQIDKEVQEIRDRVYLGSASDALEALKEIENLII